MTFYFTPLHKHQGAECVPGFTGFCTQLYGSLTHGRCVKQCGASSALFHDANHARLTTKRCFYTSKLTSLSRIGPHKSQVIDVIVGNLLGDGFAEKRGNSTRIVLKQSAQKINYIHALHKTMVQAGVCNANTPKTKTTLGKSGKVYYNAKFATFSFTQFNYLHDAFYKLGEKNNLVKQVPQDLRNLLTPRGLAHWIMDKGTPYKHRERVGGLRLSAESFCLAGAEELKGVLWDNFNLVATVHGDPMQSQSHKPVIYISRFQQEKLSKWVKPYLEPTMWYKILP